MRHQSQGIVGALWILFINYFTVYFWERVCACGRGGGRERESQADSVGPDMGLDLMSEIMIWAKMKHWTINWLNHSGPLHQILKSVVLIVLFPSFSMCHCLNVYPVIQTGVRMRGIVFLCTVTLRKQMTNASKICLPFLFIDYFLIFLKDLW